MIFEKATTALVLSAWLTSVASSAAYHNFETNFGLRGIRKMIEAVRIPPFCSGALRAPVIEIRMDIFY